MIKNKATNCPTFDKDISIIIINYFTYDFIQNCINSIKQKSHGFSFEIIIVDNSNDKDEFLKLKSLSSNTTHLLNPQKNMGFGPANNLGARIASGKYLLFLNGDTELINNAFFSLFSFMELNKTCGITGPNFYKSNLRPNTSFQTKDLSLLQELKKNNILFSFFRKFIHNDCFNYSCNPKNVSIIVGACLMIRHSLFNQINGFDYDFFMYAEESYLCYKVKAKTNYSIINVPKAKVIHFGEGSFKNITQKYAEFYVDGNYTYQRKVFGLRKAKIYLYFCRNQSFLNYCIFLVISKKRANNAKSLYVSYSKKIAELSRNS